MKGVVRLCVDASSLRPSRSGPVTGGIWLSLGQRKFPEERWNDFVVVILESWGQATIRLLTGVSDRETIHFMDGPFEARVLSLPANILEFTTVERGGRADAVEKTSSRVFVDSLIMSAAAVLTACRDQSCWSTDAEKLSLLLPLLRRTA
jgi:hypothetical protein